MSGIDLIFLNEIKTPLNFSLPGFRTFRTDRAAGNRGGCAILVANWLIDDVHSVEVITDLISIRFKSIPDVIFICIYLPPNDSPFFTLNSLAYVNGLLQTNMNDNFVVLGDLNSRFGPLVNLFLKNVKSKDFSYIPSDDKIISPNENAKIVQKSLNSLIPVNNLSIGHKTFKSCLSFRKKKNWISELDYCFITPTLIDSVISFNVNQNLSLPSDHAPVTLTFDINKLSPRTDTKNLLDRALLLGEHVIPTSSTRPLGHRQIRLENTDCNKFKREIMLIDPPQNIDDISASVVSINNVVLEKLKACRITDDAIANIDEPIVPDRWTRIITQKNPRDVWKAIDWKGCATDGNEAESPSDAEFKLHFENLLNPDGVESLDLISLCAGPSIPITDDPISFDEFKTAAASCKFKSSGGPSGIPAAAFKFLPDKWINFLCLLLNMIFLSRSFPTAWCVSRLVTIFKKGSKKACDNYRGLSIMDSLAKIYDRILYHRLDLWFKPDREQAGALKGRSCTEWIVTLRLLMDYALYKKVKLFILFVDFSKAYDRVPRNGLIESLKALGCGIVMLCAIAAMYSSTQLVLGAAIISVTLGVKQGSPSSCFLFTLYVNPLIRELKAKCGNDGFLRSLHCLLLMDDTVIFSTSREGLLKKVAILDQFCAKSGMKVNSSKTKFMVLNGDNIDKRDISASNYTIELCKFYVYLGATFCASGKLVPSLEKHAEDKFAHVLKFVSFMNKNSMFPFRIKKLVMDAAFMSAVFYGCESWLTNNFKPMKTTYFSVIKALLGVRKTTANDLCLIELGVPSVKAYIQNIQFRYFKRIFASRIHVADDPFIVVFNLCKDANTPCSSYISALLQLRHNIVEADIEQTKNRIRLSDKTKLITYRELCPDLSSCTIYNTNVNELLRMKVTRLRLSSHNLAIEMGRWSRIERERRLCACGQIQTEHHVLCDCILTFQYRNRNKFDLDFSNLPQLFKGGPNDICQFVKLCLSEFGQ